jgi:hypothetical protein
MLQKRRNQKLKEATIAARRMATATTRSGNIGQTTTFDEHKFQQEMNNVVE